MRIFKCIFTGAEIFCDNDRPVTEVDDCMYSLQGKYIEVGGEDFGLAANCDEDAAEGATAEATADGKQKVIDVVHFNRYQETGYDKKTYLAHIKGYLKKINDKIKQPAPGSEEPTPEQEEYSKKFMAAAQAFIKKVIGEIGEYQFFQPAIGDDDDPEATMVVLAKWDGETPTYFYWKDGVKGEKV